MLVIVDAFTKCVWLYPVKDATSAATLKKIQLQQEVFGSPRRIISDRGVVFTSNNFKAYCEKENIEHVLIATGVPRGNGQVERMNGIIIPALTKLSIADPFKWYQHVIDVQRFINGSTSRSTKKTPFELMFGVPMRNPEDVLLASAIEEAIRDQFEGERKQIRDNGNRRSYNKHRKPARQYEIGDLVAIQRTQFITGGKVQADFMGPYRVITSLANDRYEVVLALPAPQQPQT